MTIRRTLFPAATLLLLAATLLLPGSTAAQELDLVQKIDFDRPESWAMQYFGSIALPLALGVPRATDSGSVELGLEVGWVPSLSEAERTVGFDGRKTEDLNRTSSFARLRLEIGLPYELSLGLGWVPPADQNGVEANLFALALGRPIWASERWRIGLRIHGQTGSIEGDLTCSAREVAGADDPVINPFGCEEPSRDAYDISVLGLEAGVSRWLDRDRSVELYGTLAFQTWDLEFQVDARYAGIVDRNRLLADGTTPAATLGVDWRFAQRFDWSTAVFHSPLEVARGSATTRTESVTNVRTRLAYRLR